MLEKLARARSEGDLSENAGYHAAREALAITEFQIRTLEYKLGDAELVELNGNLEAVITGTTVTLRDLDSESERRYRVAEMEESVDDLPVLTPGSPLGKALEGKRVDEIVELTGPRGTRRYRVMAITED